MDTLEWQKTFIDVLNFSEKNTVVYLNNQQAGITQSLVKAIRRDFQYGFNFFETLLQHGSDPTKGVTLQAIFDELSHIEKEALRSKVGLCHNVLKKKGIIQEKQLRKEDMIIVDRVQKMRQMLDKYLDMYRALQLTKAYYHPNRFRAIRTDSLEVSVLKQVVLKMNQDTFLEFLSYFHRYGD